MLKIEKISKSYEGLQALNEISCTLNPNSITVLLGPNGAGKSTLMRIIAGLMRPDSGRIYSSEVAMGQNQKIHTSIGFIADNQMLEPSLRVESLLLLIARLKQVANPMEEILRWVDEFQIAHVLNKPVEALSSGYKQRVALAQAFLGNSKLLLLDEPGLSLDPGQYQQFEKILVREKKNRCILLSTHRLKDIERIGDQLILLNHGKVIGEGSKNDLLNPIQKSRQKLELKISSPSLSKFLVQSSIKHTTSDHRVFLLEDLTECSQALILGFAAENKIFIDSLSSAQKGLEDLFFNMLNVKDTN